MGSTQLWILLSVVDVQNLMGKSILIFKSIAKEFFYVLYIQSAFPTELIFPSKNLVLRECQWVSWRVCTIRLKKRKNSSEYSMLAWLSFKKPSLLGIPTNYVLVEKLFSMTSNVDKNKRIVRLGEKFFLLSLLLHLSFTKITYFLYLKCQSK